MIQSWYLAADMQLFIISPLFIYPLWRWKNKFGLAWVILVLTTVIVAITTVYIIWDLPATNTILERPYNHPFITLYNKYNGKFRAIFAGLKRKTLYTLITIFILGHVSPNTWLVFFSDGLSQIAVIKNTN